MRQILVTLLIAAALFAGALPAAAEPAGDLEALVETLEDDGRRAALLRDLKSLVAIQRDAAESAPDIDGGARFLDALSERVGAISQQLVIAASVVLDLPDAAALLWAGLLDPASRDRWLSIIGQIVLVLAAGIAAEWLARRVLRRPVGAIEARADDDVWLTVILLVARTVLDLAPIAAFAAAAFGGLTLFGPDQAGRVAAVTLLNASILARTVVAVARMLLAPRITDLRLFPMGDETANYLFVWIRRLTNLSVYGYFIIQASLLLGLPVAAHNALQKLLGLSIVLLLVMLVLQNRQAVARWVRGDGDGPLPALRRRLADIWHILVILYLTASFTVWALEIEGGFEFVLRATVLTLTIVFISRLLELSIRKAVRRAFTLGQELNARLPGLEDRANRYLPVAQTVARGLLYLIVALAILQTWGIDVFSWLASATGRAVIGRAVTVALIVVVAFLLWEIVSALVERSLSEQDAAGNAVTRSQRLRTLLPLLRNVFMVVLIVLVTMTVLSEIGLNIAPLLAGAGVIGLAVGFGAQTLVKDIITGLFILLEDTISVGDVISVAGHSGVVEAVTIRTIRLRDISGTVHTVPFSDVSTIENRTRDFAYAVLNIGVAYREDIDAVIDVIKDIGAALRADPAYADHIVEDIQVQGLDRFDDSAVVIRARIKTKPLQQWGVRRGFNLAMKRRFDELGIEIPFPHQTIYFGEDRAGAAPAAPVRLIRDAPAKRDAPPMPTRTHAAGKGASEEDHDDDGG
jgi:small conductance mechanosensitive channel